MYRYCANCDNQVRHLVYVEGEGDCCLSCAERLGVEEPDDDCNDDDGFEPEPVVIEPPTYAAFAEMQGRHL